MIFYFIILGEQLKLFEDDNSVLNIELYPDGKKILSISTDYKFKMWELQSGNFIQK